MTEELPWEVIQASEAWIRNGIGGIISFFGYSESYAKKLIIKYRKRYGEELFPKKDNFKYHFSKDDPFTLEFCEVFNTEGRFKTARHFRITLYLVDIIAKKIRKELGIAFLPYHKNTYDKETIDKISKAWKKEKSYDDVVILLGLSSIQSARVIVSQLRKIHGLKKFPYKIKV